MHSPVTPVRLRAWEFFLLLTFQVFDRSIMADTQDHNCESTSSAPAIDAGTVDIFLLCYLPSPLFHAHWAVFVPDQARPTCGTVVNVRGDPLNGFAHEFERGYIPSEDPEKPPKVLNLGAIAKNLIEFERPVPDGKDATACNQLERLALSVDAPGRSLGRGASKDGRVRLEIRDCQWWVRQLISSMIEQEIISRDAQRVLDDAPQH
ncbi:hypothetical protein KVR01_007192 [Diaporthe batatas]|uniref:uncharacterized protein n=1 Tax=Diaporthe batatas TaxID=748121 RepID=UPI001D04BC4F|nr:uncharacterized protein KVR01_007192 [Diaporthe batatas]KAG8162714.1 hypothetical protein KVR01_007192 [Diaporthe batatas]